MSFECRDCFEQIAPWLMGDLDADQVELVKEHVARCERCGVERDRLLATLGQLKSLEDETVPHPFFVPPEASPPRWRRWLTAVNTKPVWAAAALATLAAVLVLGGFRVSVSNGTLMAGFGSSAEMPDNRSKAEWDELARHLLLAVEERLHSQEKAFQASLGESLTALSLDLDAQQKQRFDELVRGFQSRLSAGLEEGGERLEEELNRFIQASYQDFQLRYHQDLSGMNQNLEALARRDDLQDEMMTRLREAVLLIAEEAVRGE